MGRLALRNIDERRRGRAVLQFSVPPESRMSDLSAGDIDLILTDDEADLRLDPSRWPLVSCRIEPPGRGYEAVNSSVMVSLAQADFDGPLMRGLVQRTRDDNWFVDRGFRDVNTGRAVAFLADLARAQAA